MEDPVRGRFAFLCIRVMIVLMKSHVILVADRMIDILPKHAFWSLCIMQWNA